MSTSSDMSHSSLTSLARSVNTNRFVAFYNKFNIHLGADLVATLASLDVHDFTHFVELFYDESYKLSLTHFSALSLRQLG